MTALAKKVSTLSADTLREMAAMLSNDSSAEADIVLAEILGALEGLMSEAAFIAFCDTL